jgi:hypothetical protein
VDPGRRPDTARLRLQAGEARIVEERERVPRFQSLGTIPTTGSSKEESVKTELELTEVHLTLPCQRVRYWPTDLEVPLDRDVILHAFLPRGKEGSLLVGRVRSVPPSE